MTKYSAILIDPPWSFKVYSDKGKGRSAENHYPVMTIEDMKAIDLDPLMDDNCALFMWCTWPNLLEAFALVEGWNARMENARNHLSYSTCAFLWAKTNRRAANRWVVVDEVANWFMGMGYWTRANTEPCLLFTKGSPKRKARNVRQLVIDIVREHSRKPDIYSRIEALVDGPYLEVFARQRREGWDAIGNHIDGKDIRDVVGVRLEKTA